MTASMENYKNIDGREVGYAIMDEVKDTREVAVKEVVLGRIRAPGICLNMKYDPTRDLLPFVPIGDHRAGRQVNPLYVCTSPAKEKWLADMFSLDRDQEAIERHIFSQTDYYNVTNLKENQTVVISSAYHNPHLPPNFIENNIRRYGPDRAASLVFGSPFGKVGSEYYNAFRPATHTKDVSFEAGHPVKISFDFNSKPYMTLIVLQIIQNGERWAVNFIDEYCLTSPKNTIEAVTGAFIDDYAHLLDYGLDYYGDASGKNSLPLEETRNFYAKIAELLADYTDTRSRKLLRKNPLHRSVGNKTMGRRDLMNHLLNGGSSVDIFISPRCEKLLADYKYIKEDKNGAKYKELAKENKVVFEKYGHASDAADAVLAYEFGDFARD